MQRGIADTVTHKVVELFSGRFVYLHRAIRLVHYYKGPHLPEDDMFRTLEQDIFGLLVEKQKVAVHCTQPYLLQVISKEGCVSPSSLLKELETEEQIKAAKKSIRELVAVKSAVQSFKQDCFTRNSSVLNQQLSSFLQLAVNLAIEKGPLAGLLLTL